MGVGTEQASSLVGRLVAALTVDGSPHLLVQHDATGAVLALDDGASGLVLVPCEWLPHTTELVAKLEALRTRDSDDVWEPLAGGPLHVVAVVERSVPGPPPPPPELREFRGIPVLVHRLDAEDRRLVPPLVDGLPKTLLVALEAPPATPDDATLRARERQGEAELARLARFRRAIAVRSSPVTYLLAGAWILVLVGVYVLGGPEGAGVLWRSGALEADTTTDPWRLLSASMLHAGPQHILGNAYGIAIFGAVLEPVFGPGRFALLYAITVVAASQASAWHLGDGLSVGASGGVFGLMGLALGLGLAGGDVLPRAERAGLRAAALGLLVWNALFSLLPGVDWLAHLGGFAAGLLLGVARFATAGMSAPGDDDAPGAIEWFMRASGLVAVVALLVSVPVEWAINDAAELLGDVPLVPAQVVVGGRALVVEVPRAAATRVDLPEGERPDVFRHASFGRPTKDPLTVSLLVWNDGLPDDLDAAMREEEANFKPVHEGLGGALQHVTIGGRPFLYRDEGDGSHPLRRWRGYVGHLLVDVLVSVEADAREKWNALPDRLVAGLRERAE